MKITTLAFLLLLAHSLQASNHGFPAQFSNRGGGFSLQFNGAEPTIHIDSKGRLVLPFSESSHDVSKDAGGRPKHVRHKGGRAAVRLAYNDSGQLISVRSKSGKLIKLIYGKNGMLRAAKFPDGHEEPISN